MWCLYFVDRFADNAHGYVGADLMAVVKEAGMKALRRNLEDIEANRKSSHNNGYENLSDNHFLVSLEDVREAFQYIRPSGLREVAIDVPKVNIFKLNFMNVVCSYHQLGYDGG